MLKYLLLEPLEEVLLDLIIGLISSSTSSDASLAASLKCLIIFLSSAVASALLQEHKRVTKIFDKILISSLPFSGLRDASSLILCWISGPTLLTPPLVMIPLRVWGWSGGFPSGGAWGWVWRGLGTGSGDASLESSVSSVSQALLIKTFPNIIKKER